MRLTIVETCGRFIVESDKATIDLIDLVSGKAPSCLRLSEGGTLTRAGSTWPTREEAERAIKRFRIMAG